MSPHLPTAAVADDEPGSVPKHFPSMGGSVKKQTSAHSPLLRARGVSVIPRYRKGRAGPRSGLAQGRLGPGLGPKIGQKTKIGPNLTSCHHFEHLLMQIRSQKVQERHETAFGAQNPRKKKQKTTNKYRISKSPHGSPWVSVALGFAWPLFMLP